MVAYKTFRGSENGKIIEGSFQKNLSYNDVLIEITHSGLCGTDVHYKNADIALGHEGVGIVKEVGPHVGLFKPGDRVGFIIDAEGIRVVMREHRIEAAFGLCQSKVSVTDEEMERVIRERAGK